MTTRNRDSERPAWPRRLRGAAAGLALAACLGAAPAPAPAPAPQSLDALAGPPSNRFT